MTMNTQLNAPRELSLEEVEMVSGGTFSEGGTRYTCVDSTHVANADDCGCSQNNPDGSGSNGGFWTGVANSIQSASDYAFSYVDFNGDGDLWDEAAIILAGTALVATVVGTGGAATPAAGAAFALAVDNAIQ